MFSHRRTVNAIVAFHLPFFFGIVCLKFIEFCKFIERRCIHTWSLPSKIFVSNMTWYQMSHKKLFAANDANRFMWRVIRAHLRDLKWDKRGILMKNFQSLWRCKVGTRKLRDIFKIREKLYTLKLIKSCHGNMLSSSRFMKLLSLSINVWKWFSFSYRISLQFNLTCGCFSFIKR
jgi:hypothetical protein